MMTDNDKNDDDDDEDDGDDVKCYQPMHCNDHLYGFSYTEYSLHNIHREMEVRRGIDEIALKVEWLIDDDDDHRDDDDDDNDDGDRELTKLV